MSDQFNYQPSKEDYKKQARQIRNRRSAQESRDRKRRYMELLEETNEQLRLENEDLKRRLKIIEEDHISFTKRFFSPGVMNHRAISEAYANHSSIVSFSNNIDGSDTSLTYNEPMSIAISPTHSQDAIGYMYNNENSFQTPSPSASLKSCEEEEEDISDESAELVISNRPSSSFVSHPSGNHLVNPASAPICVSRPKDIIKSISYPQQSDPSAMVLTEKANTIVCIPNLSTNIKIWQPLQAQRLLVSFSLTHSLAIPIVVTIKNLEMDQSQLSFLLRIIQVQLVTYARVTTCMHVLNCLFHLLQSQKS